MQTTTSKTVSVSEIRSRDCKRFGQSIPGTVHVGHHAEIIPGKSIKLHGIETRYPYNREEGRVVETTVCYARTFEIGDMAEYDSYNLSYYGEIVSITEKTVSIREEGCKKLHRLDIHDFDRRNWDFDVDAVAKTNSDMLVTL